MFHYSVSLKQQMVNQELVKADVNFTKEESQSCLHCRKAIKLWKSRQMVLFSMQNLKMMPIQTKLKKKLWMER